MTLYLTYNDVVLINEQVIKKYSEKEDIGVKSPELLESAVGRPRQSAFGVDAYPNLVSKAIALYESILKNHCFYNGNKRTATLALVLFLRINGFRLDTSSFDLADLSVYYTTGKLTTEEVVDVLKKNVHSIDGMKSVSEDFRVRD